jgi:hypothetical protein
MERAIKRLNHELDFYTIIEHYETRIIIAYKYRNQIVHFEITENHPFQIPRAIYNLWNHDRYAKLPMYIYKYLGICGENTNPLACIYCRLFDYWTPSNTIPNICDIFVRVDEFISNAVKMEFVFQNKYELPEDLVPTIFSYLQSPNVC